MTGTVSECFCSLESPSVSDLVGRHRRGDFPRTVCGYLLLLSKITRKGVTYMTHAHSVKSPRGTAGPVDGDPLRPPAQIVQGVYALLPCELQSLSEPDGRPSWNLLAVLQPGLARAGSERPEPAQRCQV